MLARIAVAACAAALLAVPAAAKAEDVSVTAFDGTEIVAHWFPQPALQQGATAPTVLVGPGWGSAGENDPTKNNIALLNNAGYNVLTWDPRGFGKSGGVVNVDSPDFEGRDVQKLLDFVAGQPEATLDGPGDARVGMAGGSYGGGIQFVTAAIDSRVDAIVPNIAWHSLRTSLYKESIVKEGWANRLYSVAASRPLDPHIKDAWEQGQRTGSLTREARQWFVDRGPGTALIDRIKVPTLIQQGTVDTLFSLDEAITNYRILRDNGVPVSMLWFCGGHGVCLTDQGDRSRVARSTVAWFDRYLKGDTSVDTGPRFDWIDQNGKRFIDRDWPVKSGAPLVGTGRGRLRLVARGGAGPPKAPEGIDVVGIVALGITPGRAKNAVNVQVPAKRATTLVGAPRVTLTYRGRTGKGGRPQRVFAQLVDARSGKVLGNQITPIAVKLDGKRHKVSRSLEVVAHSLAKRRRVTLQLVASTVAYAKPQLGGSVRFERVRVSIPTRAR